jgi:putative transposase
VHFNVTEGPSAQWTGQQLVNAFPDDSAPKYIIRDRDKIYGANFVRRVRTMGIEQVLTAPRSPWQNPYCERVIGTLRRAASSLHATRCLTQSLGPARRRA